MPPRPDPDDLAAAVRDLVRHGERLGDRAEAVLEEVGPIRIELATLRAEVTALTARLAAIEGRRPISSDVIGAVTKSPRLQAGVAAAVVLLALAVAGLIWPGIVAALPLLGSAHAP